jgi:hypothetical protein
VGPKVAMFRTCTNADRAGFEPTSNGVTTRCSTVELLANRTLREPEATGEEEDGTSTAQPECQDLGSRSTLTHWMRWTRVTLVPIYSTVSPLFPGQLLFAAVSYHYLTL